MRPPGQRLSIRERIALAARIRELLAAKPTATVDELRAATGAPRPQIVEVRRRMERDLASWGDGGGA